MIGKIYTFQVKGIGVFPFSLLSEQCCFPMSKEDAAKVFESKYSNRAITMQSHRLPSSATWKSFGWSIVGISDPLIESEDYNLYHTWPC